MNPRRPYLLRAMIDWIVDSGQTPYILVQADADVQVPQAFVKDGRIVLNVSQVATRGLSITNEYVMFDGRFGGQSFPISVPMRAVLAVYTRETGEGMLFDPEYPEVPEGQGKRGELSAVGEVSVVGEVSAVGEVSVVDGETSKQPIEAAPGKGPGPGGKPGRGGRPNHLTSVK